MRFCSDKARALCPAFKSCGSDVRGDFTETSWCAGFNDGVELALEQAIDFRPIIAAARTFAEALPAAFTDPRLCESLRRLAEEAKEAEE